MMRRIIIGLLGITVLIVMSMKPDLAFADSTKPTRYSLEMIVSITAAGLGGIMEAVEDPKEQIDILRRYIQPVRFFPDRSGYFFVYDITGRLVAHPTQPEIVGRRLEDIQSIEEHDAVKNFIATARKGGGYVEYWWIKPKTGVAQEKLSFVAHIPNTGLFLGTGIYFSSLPKH